MYKPDIICPMITRLFHYALLLWLSQLPLLAVLAIHFFAIEEKGLTKLFSFLYYRFTSLLWEKVG